MAVVPAVGRADRATEPAAHAASVLFERYRARVYAYCLHQLTSREEAEDATQTTFMNAFRGLERGVVPESEQAWLFKIAENVCLSRRRSSWRRGRIESPSDLEVIEEVIPSPSRELADELIGLQDALEALPENQRRAILLREWQGLSYREIAEELELSQAAVETLIFRARRTLATGLEDPEPVKKRRRILVGGVNLGSTLAALKEVFLGGAAAKTVAVAVAATSTAAATQVPGESADPRRFAPGPAVVQSHPTPPVVREQPAFEVTEPAPAHAQAWAEKPRRAEPALVRQLRKRPPTADEPARTPAAKPSRAKAAERKPAVRALLSRTASAKHAGRPAHAGPRQSSGPLRRAGTLEHAGPPLTQPRRESAAREQAPAGRRQTKDK